MTLLGATWHVDVDSAHVGDVLRVFVGHAGDDPEAVLVVLDGNGLFGLALDLVRLMRLPGLLPPLAVVGVGYPGAATVADTLDVRVRDLTPTPADGVPSGGAARFLDALRHDVLPQVARQLGPRAQERTVLFGHSLGGLLCLYDALRARPLCDAHVASSPSLWWDRHWLLRAPLPARASGGRSRDLYVGIGGEETDEGRRREAAGLPDDHPLKPPGTHLDMVADVRRLEQRLRTCPAGDLRLAVSVLPDEYHATVAPAVLTRGLRHVFSRP